ncbi:MAG: hypothetical protein WB609_09675 [Candidatus Cybelea sp.]
MTFTKMRSALLAAIVLAAAAACGGNNAVPSTPQGAANAASSQVAAGIESLGIAPDDTTSILKKLKKDVVIGSTVDVKNGDRGPRGISVVGSGFGKLKKGQIVVCNFEDKGGTAGNGTTVELLASAPGSKPARFVQNTKIKGCADAAVSPASDYVYVSGFSSHLAVQFTPTGALKKTWGKPLAAPIGDVDGACPGGPSCLYSSEYVYVADANIGGIVSFSVNNYGNKKATEVISGFAVNKKSGWTALGPTALAYDAGKSGTLYAIDGVDNTVVSFNNASELLVADEIAVLKGGKTFKCKYPKSTCGSLIFAGSPLNAPVAMTRLPNGNLIVANSGGSSPDTLVELTKAGKVLATKVVDTSKTAGIFGIYAIGTNDANTALYYTDAIDSSLHELEQ